MVIELFGSIKNLFKYLKQYFLIYGPGLGGDEMEKNNINILWEKDIEYLI